MKAARLIDGDVTVVDRDVVEPGEAQVRRDASAPPACATPTSTSRAATGPVSPPTVTGVGHEAIGVVEALGPGAERYVSIGDRVILGLGGTGGGYWCGACEYCLSGQPRHCARSSGIMGTFAEYFDVYAPASSSSPTRWATTRRRSRAAGSPRTAR